MQKVFGSFAMKVIISTSVPFMIIQDNSEIKTLKNIMETQLKKSLSNVMN